MKGPSGKLFEGVYSNPRLTHTIASLVGCIVQLQVKNGEMFEGILGTFSQKVDFALEVVHKVEFKKPGSPCNLLSTNINPEEVVKKMVFKIEDIVMISAVDVDLDYVTRDSFTDTGISKFNGQVTERVLEPWDGGISNSEGLAELGNDEVSNGWDPNDMFRTNEVKYGVKSSFDSNMQEYTIPLKKQNTEEYKLQEAKASKIAQEIESGLHYKNRLALENGDEEERFSSVVRPESNATNNNNNSSSSTSSTSSSSSNSNNTSNRFVTYRGRKPQSVLRPVRSSPSPNAHMSNRIVNSHPPQHPPPQHYHKVVSCSSSQAISSQGKIVNSKPVPPSISSAPRPLPQRQIFISASQGSSSQQQQNSGQLPPMASRTFSQSSNSAARNSPISNQPPAEDIKVNGDPTTPTSASQPSAPVLSAGPPPGTPTLPLKESQPETQSNNELSQHSKEVPEKKIIKKAHDEKTDELRRFHEKFKLPDVKESKKETTASVPSVPEVPDSAQNQDPSPKSVNETKSKVEKVVDHTDEESLSEAMKNSNLNPNAKEFSLNPNAKSFTPRGLSMPTNMLPPAPPPPQPVQPPPRMHAQSPVIAVPQPHLVPSIPHPVFNVTPHYVVPTPVTVPVAPPYTPQSSVAQAPRYRKDQEYGLAMEVNECEDVIFSAMPMTFPRTDSSQSIHVQAATGQPILAPHALSTPQFTIQYASPGILHPPPGPSQPQLTYTQMYSIGHRVLTPQALGMVSTAGSYGENHHVPTQIYMNPQAVAANMAHQGPPGSSGQHSTPSTPQSQTPSLHPAPSPVHQPPPPQSAGPHGQAPTPTGHPSNPPTPHLVYHGQLAAAQHLSAAHGNHGHPYSAAAAAAAAVYGAAPQPIMLLPQQAVTGPHPHHHPAQFSAAMQNHFHAQAAGAHGGGGGPTQIIPHPPVAMMPTSTAMAHAQVSLTNSHYAPHSQV